MNMKAIHAIYRVEKKKQVRVAPGTVFDCPEDEAKEYLDRNAAAAVAEAGGEKPAKKAAAKKPAAKPGEKPAANADGLLD